MALKIREDTKIARMFREDKASQELKFKFEDFEISIVSTIRHTSDCALNSILKQITHEG